MKRSIRYTLAGCALLLLASVVAGFAFSGGAPQAELRAAASAEETKPSEINEIHGYRAWTQVNPQPVLISPQVSILCAAPLPPPPTDDSRSPHVRKLITVYVNDLGRHAMMNELKPTFPVGSVIVKEKLSPDKKDAPELLTVMLKRERGFNPSGGDWEYMAVNGEATKIEARGLLESCQACHASMKATDFIYRSYLPDELRDKLR